jgi:serine/threonine protein kinase
MLYGVFKISDFGQARLQYITTRSTGSGSTTDSSHGTVTHMAPELLDPPKTPDGEEVHPDPNEKTDVWRWLM